MAVCVNDYDAHDGARQCLVGVPANCSRVKLRRCVPSSTTKVKGDLASELGCATRARCRPWWILLVRVHGGGFRVHLIRVLPNAPVEPVFPDPKHSMESGTTTLTSPALDCLRIVGVHVCMAATEAGAGFLAVKSSQVVVVLVLILKLAGLCSRCSRHTRAER